MTKNILKILTNIVCLFLAGQSSAQPPPGDTVKVKFYLAQSDHHYDAEQMDSAAYYCLKAGELARALGYKRGIAEYISYYIPVLNRSGKYHEGLELALESLELSESIGDNSMLAMAYNNAGNQYQYLGDLNSSATHYLNALIFSENVDTPQRRMRYGNNLASVFLQMEEKNKSYYYAKKSYQLALETRDSLGMASSLVNLALSEILNGKHKDAIRHLDQVLALGRALKDDSYVLDALINKADVYSQMKHYSSALRLYQESFRVLQDYRVPDYELYVYWGLAKNHLHTGNFGRAHGYLKQAIAVAQDLHGLQELSKLYLLGSELYEKLNEYDSALSYRKHYQVLNDSVVGLETTRNIHKLEIEYQTAQKEKEIADQQLTIARNNLVIERKDKSIFLWAAVTILLISAISIFVLLYRSKQRLNAEKIRLLQKQTELQVLNALVEGEEKERLRLARELHDGVGGILSASKMHLSILQEGHSRDIAQNQMRNISSMLDHAAQEIRNIAHNLFPDILVKNELDVAISSYCERMKSTELNIDYYCLGKMPRLNNRFKLLVYRAIQELVNNVMKHAHAKNVLVQVSCHDSLLTVVVEDDGNGISDTGKNGIGLIDLREKVRNMNGQISIESAPGCGTTIQLEFDVSRAEQRADLETTNVNAR